MSSLYGAIDMENIKMDVHSSFAMPGAGFTTTSGPSSGGDNMGVDPSTAGFNHHRITATGQLPSSYDFTDPVLLSQLRDMENDVKFSPTSAAALDPTAFLTSPPPVPTATPMAASSSSSFTSASLSNPNSLMNMPMAFYESNQSQSQLVAPSSPSTHNSGYSPSISHPGPSPPANPAPKPSFVDTSVIPSGLPSMSSPISPTIGQHSAASSSPGSQVVTATGVPLGGVISTRHGSQVTVGAVVASVLDNVVQMASQARDAYLAGKQDQTHAQIEELLESLKLVGGLGVGPSIGAISSNIPYAEGQDDDLIPAVATGLEGRYGLEVTVPTVSDASHRSTSSPQHARSNGSANNSPGSSVSPPQRMSQPLPMASLGAPNSIQDMLATSPAHALSMSPSPPSMHSTTASSLAAALGPFPPMEDGPSSMPMAQPPSHSFDPNRKRTASSAPTLVDETRGPSKITKRSPSVEAEEEANALAGNAGSSMMSGIQSTGPPPPLLHAHTFPATLPQTQLAGVTSHIPFPVGGLAPGGSPMSSNLVVGGPPMPAQSVSPPGFAGASVSSLSGWATATDSPVGGSPSPSIVIPPPHHPTNAVLSKRFSSDALRGSPLNPAMSGVGVGSAAAFAPALYPSGLPDGLVQSLPGGMDVDMGVASSLSSFADVDMGVAPSLSSFADVVTLPGSRPGTSHGRARLSDASSVGLGSFGKPEQQHHQSSQDDFADDESEDDADSDDGEDGRRSAASSVNGSVNGSRRGADGAARPRRRGVGSGGEGSNAANALSPEVKAVVDKVFVEYLNRVCSNLDATDSKGEAIHQTLMAKKMARLDESPDFRPFKFRIQAFTNGFVEELARQGYGEEQIPIKKIKAYLWHHSPYIARFNEDGKKAKSKGNHIWNIEAKKVLAPNGDPNGPRWVFKKFVRKIAGAPPTMAYIGLKWQWEPKIWDPQLSRASIDVEFSSPNMPAWMRWEKGVLIGVPTPESHSIDLIVEAHYLQDAQQKVLSVTHPITVAPLAVGDSSYPKARRPSLLSAEANPRRFVSDSIVPQSTPLRPPLVPAAALPPPMPSANETAQVIAVMQSAASRVAAAAQTQGFPTGPAQAHAQAALAKQQQVLTVAAQVISHEAHDALVGRSIGEQPKASSVLVQAAQSVVHQAARQIQADKAAVALMHAKSGPVVPMTSTPVSLVDVSIATQSAVAHAVAITGSESSEVEVMLTANSLIQQRSRADSRTSLPMPGTSGGTPVASGATTYSHLVNPSQYLR